MAEGYDVHYHVIAAACVEGRPATSRDQWELEGGPGNDDTTEPGHSECGEDSVSVLWENEPHEESMQALGERVQKLWEEGASLDNVCSWSEPDYEDQAVGSKGGYCSEDEDPDRYTPWSNRILSMAMSGVPVHASTVEQRVLEARLLREETAERERYWASGPFYYKAKYPGAASSRRSRRQRQRGGGGGDGLTGLPERNKEFVRQGKVPPPQRTS